MSQGLLGLVGLAFDDERDEIYLDHGVVDFLSEEGLRMITEDQEGNFA